MFAGSDSARADTFTILFDEGSTVFQEADWTGTYTLDPDAHPFLKFSLK